MKLSNKHLELLGTITDKDGESLYPDGYPVPEGNPGDRAYMSEASHFHILYIDILPDGDRTRDVPVIQKYQKEEWANTLKVINNPDFGIRATGHKEFVVLHDPIEALAETKARKPKAEPRGNVKSEAK